MGEAYCLIFAFAAGMALGAFFSLNLWSSVRKMTGEETPLYMLYGNFILRISIVLIGLYLVMADRWERMIVALLGFVVAREIMVRRLLRRPKPL